MDLQTGTVNDWDDMFSKDPKRNFGASPETGLQKPAIKNLNINFSRKPRWQHLYPGYFITAKSPCSAAFNFFSFFGGGGGVIWWLLTHKQP